MISIGINGFVSNYDHNFNHVSTGGGATIEYITNDNLVGLFQFIK
jgi:3-phosphoglycerate kinase